MRYLIAIIFAIVGAALAMKFLSGPLANWAALQFKVREARTRPRTSTSLPSWLVNLGGLIVGWTIGWAGRRSRLARRLSARS